MKRLPPPDVSLFFAREIFFSRTPSPHGDFAKTPFLTGSGASKLTSCVPHTVICSKKKDRTRYFAFLSPLARRFNNLAMWVNLLFFFRCFSVRERQLKHKQVGNFRLSCSTGNFTCFSTPTCCNRSVPSNLPFFSSLKHLSLV